MIENSNPGGDIESRQGTPDGCADWEPLVTLLAAGDELGPGEQSRLAGHLAKCAGCSESLARQREMLATLALHHIEPDASLLAACRTNLSDALDRQEDRTWFARTFGSVLPSSWLAPRPAWSAAVLLLMGFTVGVLGPRLLRHPAATNTPDFGGSDIGTTQGTVPTSIDLHTADVAGINVLPSSGEGPARVEFQLRAQQPITLEGTVDDDDVKDVLLGILAKGDRICPDIRLDAVECLRARENDPDVRAALCRAVRTDRNAAVRLKALEALKSAQPADQVRQTLLDALTEDQNPGVRIEAINTLRGMAEKGNTPSDDHMVSVLRDRMQNDPNTYIRLQSAAALDELGPRARF
jgi:HEAT repeats